MEATTLFKLRATKPLFMYLSIPFKEPASAREMYETILVIFRAETDTRLEFYKTGPTLMAANTIPDFTRNILE